MTVTSPNKHQMKGSKVSCINPSNSKNPKSISNHTATTHTALPSFARDDSGLNMMPWRHILPSLSSNDHQIVAQLNWWYQVKDPILREEYYKFVNKKNGTRYVLFVTILYTLLAYPLSIAPFLLPSFDEETVLVRLAAICVHVFILVGVLCGWLLVYRDKCDSWLSSYFHWKERRRDKFFQVLQHTMIVSVTMFYLFQLLRRMYFPICNNSNAILRVQYGDGSCEDKDSRITMILGSAVMVLSPPLFYFATMPSTRIELMWALVAIAAAVTIYVAIDVGGGPTLVQYLIWVISVVLVSCDIQSRNFTIYWMTRKLEDTLKENERMADELHATEMRQMIGNVAHDLKTPLSSLTTGIEYIQLLVDEQESTLDGGGSPDTVVSFIANIQSCLHNIRNTNSFMLMAINRCIDYTKASKGMKLVPRYETIDLMETLQLPLNCIQGIQSRIEIKLLDISNDICSHIITDKQWLQENILCLFSNAVKFSTFGCVTVQVSLLDNADKERELDFANFDAAFKAPKKEVLVIPVTPTAVSGNGNGNEFSLFARKQTCSSNRVYPGPEVSNNSWSGVGMSIDAIKPASVVEDRSSSIFVDDDQVWLLVEIEDTGIGVPEEALSTLFNPFKQAQRLVGGTGLGLYSFAKRIEALKGSYGVKKRKDGKQGSLFWFAIPYRPDAMTAAMSAHHRRNSLKNEATLQPQVAKLTVASSPTGSRSTPFSSPPLVTTTTDIPLAMDDSNSGNNSGSLLLLPSKSTPLLSSLDKLKILIVDDSPAIIKMTSMVLKKLGHDISSAENGEVAVKAVTEKWRNDGDIFDVILMDLQMPVMDGLEATRRIRVLESECPPENSFHTMNIEHSIGSANGLVTTMPLPRQVIIGMSANSDHETTEAAFDVGMDAFLGKPFNVSTFSDMAKSLVTKNFITSSKKKTRPDIKDGHKST